MIRDRNQLHQDVVWALKVPNINFHLVPLIVKFYSIVTRPALFVLKFSYHWDLFKISFLESMNILDQRPVLRSCRLFHFLSKYWLSNPCGGVESCLGHLR